MLTHLATRRCAEEPLLSHAHMPHHGSNAIIATDVRFIITAWNHAAEALYGWSAHEVIGQPIEAVLQTTYIDDDQPQQVRQQVITQGHWHGEVLQQRKDGSPLTVLTAA